MCIHRVDKDKTMLTTGESKQRVYKYSEYYSFNFSVDLKRFPHKS